MRSLVLRADTPLDDGVKGMIAGQLDVAAVRLARSTRRFGGQRGGEVARTAITRLDDWVGWSVAVPLRCSECGEVAGQDGLVLDMFLGTAERLRGRDSNRLLSVSVLIGKAAQHWGRWLMREFHERDTGDGAGNEPDVKPEHKPDSKSGGKPDSRPDGAAGDGGDSRRPGVVVVRDAATRKELSLEYQQRVKAVYAAARAADAAPPDDRGDRARDMPVNGDRAASPPASRNAEDLGGDHRGEGARSKDTARQPTRGTDLPVNARDLPDARDVLPNLDKAEIDERKLSEYSLNPGHPDNRGKAGGWRALGYDVDSPQGRRDATQELRGLVLSELLACGKVVKTRDTPYGPSHTVLNGITGPNGRAGTLVTCWRVEDRAGAEVPRLVSTWVKPHTDRETER
jgi:hypothetical protein